jgi:hypothetical protein
MLELSRMPTRQPLEMPSRYRFHSTRPAPGSLRGFSFANFVRNKLSEQILKLAWQRRAEERQIVRVQLTTDCR